MAATIMRYGFGLPASIGVIAIDTAVGKMWAGTRVGASIARHSAGRLLSVNSHPDEPTERELRRQAMLAQEEKIAEVFRPIAGRERFSDRELSRWVMVAVVSAKSWIWSARRVEKVDPTDDSEPKPLSELIDDSGFVFVKAGVPEPIIGPATTILNHQEGIVAAAQRGEDDRGAPAPLVPMVPPELIHPSPE